MEKKSSLQILILIFFKFTASFQNKKLYRMIDCETIYQIWGLIYLKYVYLSHNLNSTEVNEMLPSNKSAIAYRMLKMKILISKA